MGPRKNSRKNQSQDQSLAAPPGETILPRQTLDLIKIQFLKQVDLFKNFPDALIEQMAAEFPEVILTRDRYLFHEGDPEREMYLILCGKLLITRMNKKIALLGPGQYLGEMALIESKPRSASALAMSDMVLLKIVEDHFKSYLLTDPSSVVAMMKTLSSRLRQDVEEMAFEMRRLNNFTHDMRNCVVPLSLVECLLDDAVQLLRGTSQGHKPRRGCDQVDKGFRTVLAVRNNLLTLMEQSLACSRRLKRDYIRKQGDLFHLIRETVEEMTYHKYLKGKQVTLKHNPPVAVLDFNFLDIKRVVQNLLINGGYVTGPGGDLEVLIQGTEREVEVSVRDYGPGIPKEIQPRLFQEDLTTKPDGNGFGLLSCKEIVEDYHNGRIWFETEPGKGTIFHFTLPTRLKKGHLQI